jgi:chaperonin GroES
MDLDLNEILQGGNLAEILDDSKLAEIGKKCKDGLDIDERSREDWMERHDKAMDLAMQVTEEKNWPWDGASNIIYPAITTGAMQFAARAYPALVPGKNLVKCAINGDDDGIYEVGQIDPQTGQPQSREIVPPGAKAAKADRVARHMSWQLLDQIENWVEDTDAALQYLAIAGCFFRKNQFNASIQRIDSKWLPASQLVVNMDAESLERAARISEYYYLHPYEVKERVNRGEYYVPENKDLDALISEPESVDDDQGLVCLVEQHTRLDLDGDGYPEPYVVFFHKDSGHVFGLYAHFTPDDVEMNMDGVVAILHKPPYVKYEFLPNPNNGFYGIGLGWLLGPLNEQINTTINQLNDAATLQNTPMGFVSRGLRIKGGDYRFEPGEFKQVDVAGGNIRENLYQLQFQGPSPVLFQLLGLMIESTRDISSVKDIMTGGMEQNVAPTTAMTLVEQGSKQFNSIFKRVHRAMGKELKQIFLINSRTLPPQQYFQFMDDRQAVSAEDYDPDSLDVTPVTDSNMATDAKKTARLQGLMQAAQMFGPMMNRKKLFMEMMEGLEVPSPEEWYVEPQPSGPDPDQQAKLMKSQADMIRAQAEAANVQTDSIKGLGDFIENYSSAILNIARAESEEEGRQVEQYIGQLRDLQRMIERDEARASQRMAGGQPNQGNPGLAQGNPAGPQGMA